jgi:hypothetical protein
MGVTEKDGTRRRVGLLHRAIWLVGGGLVAAGNGIAQDAALSAINREISPSGEAAAYPIAARRNAVDQRSDLRASVTLESLRPSLRSPADIGAELPARTAAAATVDGPDLRFETNLPASIPSTGTVLNGRLPAGELNLEGLVRASRMLVRNGAIFLEGDVRRGQETPLSGRQPAFAVPQDDSAQVRLEN